MERRNERYDVIYGFVRACGGCEKCGEMDVRMLHFDHIDRDLKEDCVSKMIISSRSIPAIFLEIAKCRILCANHHAEHTSKQGRQYSHKYMEKIKREERKEVKKRKRK
jgi:hypothetical protein